MNIFYKRFKRYRNMYKNFLIPLFVSLPKIIIFNTVFPFSFLSLHILMVFRSQSARSLNFIWWKLLNFCVSVFSAVEWEYTGLYNLTSCILNIG